MMKSTGLETRDVAYHAGISTDYIYKILRNERPNVSAMNVAMIAKALGVSVDYLMGISDDPEIDNVVRGNGFYASDDVADYLDISPERARWLRDKCRELTSITRNLDDLQEKEAQAIVMHIDSHLHQIHDLVNNGMRLSSIFLEPTYDEAVHELEE